MTQVVLGENEGIESALRRFKRQVSQAGILQDVRTKRHFETPLQSGCSSQAKSQNARTF
jgi:small subunit ribosomal protein S21